MTQDNRETVKAQFGVHAQNYVNSTVHATGDDLDTIVRMLNPQPDWRVLDVATGGGHTALKVAPHAAEVVASDLTPQMLHAARAFILGQDAQNVYFMPAEAADLPFRDGHFDGVTCRIAPHHFPDIFEFVREAARVLKPGGRVVVEDHVVPEDERAARYIDSFETLRDPSHNRVYSASEWRGAFADAGLTVLEDEQIEKRAMFGPWVERLNVAPDIVERLQVMMAQLPEAVAAWYQPKHIGTPDAVITHRYIIIAGQKPN